MTAKYTVEQHIALRRVSSIAAAPDGSWLAVAVERLDRDGVKYVSDLWRVPADGSAATRLTRGDSKDAAPAFRHDGALVFLSNRAPTEVKPDEDADKRMQVWCLPASGGEPQQITDEPLGVLVFKCAARADRLLVIAAVLPDVAHDKQRETAAERKKKGASARTFYQQPVRHWDHWLHENKNFANAHVIGYSAAGAQRIDLTPAATRELAIEPQLDLTADGRHAVVTWLANGADRELDTQLLVIDLAGGEPDSAKTRIFNPGVNCSYDGPLFSPDGQTIAAVHTERSPKVVMHPTLTLLDVASGRARAVAKQWDRWPQAWDWSQDGRAILVTADDDGDVPVFAIAADSGTVERISAAVGGGTHSNLAALRDGRVAAIHSTLLDAPECILLTAKKGGAAQPLARLSGMTPAADWAEVESFRVTSTDGADIESLITKPKGARHAPTLLWIHGGPIGMSSDGWHWRWNALLAVAQGYAVVQPNPRGSTGYGQKFVQGIWGNVWGNQCYRDLMAVTAALEKRTDVDANRIMAMGGSFGGYMTNWIGTQTQRFRCLITHASIVTMAQFTGVTDHPAWWYLEMGGEDPYADMQEFDRYAPIRHIKQWRTPTLIIHGEQDYRCPINEALNLFEALQYHHVPSELLVFPDENHWILKPRNIVAWYDSVLGFVAKYMKE